VEVNLLSSTLAALVNQGAAYTGGGVVPSRMGNAHPSIAPYELFATADGELALAVGNDRQFAVLCDVLGVPLMAGDPRFADNAGRVAHRAQLRDELQRLLAPRSARTWAAELTAARVPAGVVNDVREAFELAESLGLEPIVAVAREDGSRVRLARNPIELSRTPATYRSPPPAMPVRATEGTGDR
jgi:crotonobetainyl-CoA:carnitine CoA-transferase CaiB-like acyl-CoA transferase